MSSLSPAPCTASPPWKRSEVREACAGVDPLRAPHFGETHVHTRYSADALVGDVRAGPGDAYAFAKGAPIGLPPYDGEGRALRSARLRRPLDFAVVTDHAEHFGEIDICVTPGLAGHESPVCEALRASIGSARPMPPPGQPAGILKFFGPYTGAPRPSRFDFCGADGAHCAARASLVWNRIQAAAQEHYDRTSTCAFTTFVGYEWSGTPRGINLHRNVIFRNDQVPPLPTSYIEEPTPQGLWTALKRQCLDGLDRCDVLAIPHNPNLSVGRMFAPENADGSPLRPVDAALRARMEPVVEINQHKGDSECRPGVLSSDEICGFEKLDRATLAGASDPGTVFEPLSFVRNVLKTGLVEDERIGVNPFQLGVLGATDSHNATPGLTREDDYASTGHLGTRDATPAFLLSPYPLGGIEASPGGLAVVWAEENSRDALFAAIRRREIYGTSGTRPVVRFFAGRLPPGLCDDGRFVERGYAHGVPMGGQIGPVRGDRSPRFAVLALKDPGAATGPGAPLQRVQIVKGWLDENGETREVVHDVAGDARNGATVDPATCAREGRGFDSLCTVWEDPDFDERQRAFYYVRVLENPTCRWSRFVCNALHVDCRTQREVPKELAACCDPGVPSTIQERAWSSPIWYRPEGVAWLRAAVRFREGSTADALKVAARLGKASPGPTVEDRTLTIALGDDDEFYRVTIPGRRFREERRGKLVYEDATGRLGGVVRASVTPLANGQLRVKLSARRVDLSRADRSLHQVDSRFTLGRLALVHSRFWQADADRLRSPAR